MIWIALAFALALLSAGLSAYALYRIRRMQHHLTLRKLILVDEHNIPRLVLAAGRELPGPVIRGRFYPAEMRGGGGDSGPAGFLFLNEEGTEQGGLLWGGRKEGDGWHQFWRLSVDPYLQNEVLILGVSELNGKRWVRFDLVDRPVDPEGFEALIQKGAQASTPEQQKAVEQEIRQTYGDRWHVPRLTLARTDQGDLVLSLHDPEGTERFRLELSGDRLSGYVITPEGKTIPLLDRGEGTR